MLSGKEDLVLAELRFRYNSAKKPIPLPIAFGIARAKAGFDKQAKAILQSLESKHQIDIFGNNGSSFIVPSMTASNQPETVIREQNIKLVLQKMGKATPSEIFEEYQKMFGSVNSESLTRKLRAMAISFENKEKDHGIRRRDDEYFLKDGEKVKSLASFAVMG